VVIDIEAIEATVIEAIVGIVLVSGFPMVAIMAIRVLTIDAIIAMDAVLIHGVIVVALAFGFVSGRAIILTAVIIKGVISARCVGTIGVTLDQDVIIR